MSDAFPKTAPGSEVMYDPELGAQVINESGVSTDGVIAAVMDQHPEMAALVRWGINTQARSGSLFERDIYTTPEKIFDQFRTAHYALENDDIVSGVCDSTESLAFGKLDFEAEEEDEEDVWNQIAADIDLDGRLREMWRELFTVSQFYCAIWWGKKSYTVRGKTDQGVKRKRTFRNLRVPLALTLIDPLKVIPVGNFLFNQEQLVYIADKNEGNQIDQAMTSPGLDPTLSQLIMGKYEPSFDEMRSLNEIAGGAGISGRNLYLLNPKSVWRHGLTRPQFQRFSSVRMKSVFELLDLKHQLRQMDRAHLIGGTNFIVLVTKGSDQIPARPEEIANLQAQVRTVARVPVIVGDHRLKVEIVTPKLDSTLQPERYNGLDARITARLYLMFLTGNFSAGARGDDSIKLARVVARGLQSRRHMLRRGLEQYLIRPTVDQNDELTSQAKLRFHPKRIDLDFDPALASYYLDLRDRGDMSRESVLDEVDISQVDEARKRQREQDRYDKVFVPTNVPFSGQAGPGGGGQGNNGTPNNTGGPADPKAAGRTMGGLRNGGGAAPGTGQGQLPRNPRRRSK